MRPKDRMWCALCDNQRKPHPQPKFAVSQCLMHFVSRERNRLWRVYWRRNEERMGAKHEHHFWATMCRTEIDRNETLTRRVLHSVESTLCSSVYLLIFIVESNWQRGAEPGNVCFQLDTLLLVRCTHLFCCCRAACV